MEDSIKIPAFDLSRQIQQHRPAFLAALERVLDSGAFIMGDELQSFENEFAQFVRVKHAVGCASGTEALMLALMAVDLKERDEIITTPFTFVATVEVLALLKLKPVFVDIDPNTWNLDPARITHAITNRTKAIIPVHLFGLCAEMPQIMEIANQHHILVIEDCAQAFGAEIQGNKVGTIGQEGCFSFYPTKNLGGFGDGGIVTTNDSSIALKLRALRTHGSQKRYLSEFVGMNSRLDAVQAAILRTKLPYVPEWNKRRRGIARRYCDQLKSLPLKIPVWDDNAMSHVFHQFSIQTERRDELQAFLTSKGIGTVVYYPIPLHLQPAFAYLGYTTGQFPISERTGKTIISLPMFPEMLDNEVDSVCEAIQDFFRNR